MPAISASESDKEGNADRDEWSGGKGNDSGDINESVGTDAEVSTNSSAKEKGGSISSLFSQETGPPATMCVADISCTRGSGMDER